MKSYRFFLLILLCILSVPILMTSCFAVIDSQDAKKFDIVAAQVMDKIHLGMDIDEAIAILKKDGFMVFKKREEIDCKYDYRKMYKTEVNLTGSRNIPWHVTFRYVVGISNHRRPWLFITASLDGKIVRISRDP